MSIERDFLNGSGDLPILFHVTETFQVWDGQVALVIDHLLNHIKTLNVLSEGPVDQSVVDVLTQHPHYELGPKKYLSPETRQTVADTLIDECILLLRCLTKIAPIMEIDAKKRTQILESVRAEVPFLDYRQTNDVSVSDAQRED